MLWPSQARLWTEPVRFSLCRLTRSSSWVTLSPPSLAQIPVMLVEAAIRIAEDQSSPPAKADARHSLRRATMSDQAPSITHISLRLGEDERQRFCCEVEERGF